MSIDRSLPVAVAASRIGIETKNHTDWINTFEAQKAKYTNASSQDPQALSSRVAPVALKYDNAIASLAKSPSNLYTAEEFQRFLDQHKAYTDAKTAAVKANTDMVAARNSAVTQIDSDRKAVEDRILADSDVIKGYEETAYRYRKAKSDFGRVLQHAARRYLSFIKAITNEEQFKLTGTIEAENFTSLEEKSALREVIKKRALDKKNEFNKKFQGIAQMNNNGELEFTLPNPDILSNYDNITWDHLATLFNHVIAESVIHMGRTGRKSKSLQALNVVFNEYKNNNNPQSKPEFAQEIAGFRQAQNSVEDNKFTGEIKLGHMTTCQNGAITAISDRCSEAKTAYTQSKDAAEKAFNDRLRECDTHFNTYSTQVDTMVANITSRRDVYEKQIRDAQQAAQDEVKKANDAAELITQLAGRKRALLDAIDNSLRLARTASEYKGETGAKKYWDDANAHFQTLEQLATSIREQQTIIDTASAEAKRLVRPYSLIAYVTVSLKDIDTAPSTTAVTQAIRDARQDLTNNQYLATEDAWTQHRPQHEQKAEPAPLTVVIPRGSDSPKASPSPSPVSQHSASNNSSSGSGSPSSRRSPSPLSSPSSSAIARNIEQSGPLEAIYKKLVRVILDSAFWNCNCSSFSSYSINVNGKKVKVANGIFQLVDDIISPSSFVRGRSETESHFKTLLTTLGTIADERILNTPCCGLWGRYDATAALYRLLADISDSLDTVNPMTIEEINRRLNDEVRKKDGKKWDGEDEDWATYLSTRGNITTAQHTNPSQDSVLRVQAEPVSVTVTRSPTRSSTPSS